MVQSSGESPRSVKLTHEVSRLVARSAARGELVLAIARCAFAVAMFSRRMILNSAYGESVSTLHTALALPGIILVVVFSSWMIARVLADREVTPLMLLSSVLIDTVVCTTQLAPHVLTPRPGYLGLLRMPDVAALLVIAMAMGLRLSAKIALIGGGASLLGAAGLIALDRRLNAELLAYGGAQISIFLILLCSCVLLAALFATRTRRLSESAAAHAQQLERGRIRFSQLAQEHHDAKSTLSVLRVRSEQLLLATSGEAARIAQALHDDVEAFAREIARVGESSFEADESLHALAPADIEGAGKRAIALAARQHANVRFAVEPSHGAKMAYIVGGEATLDRLLLNLLQNACEGDGKSGASEVRLVLHSHDAMIELCVQDDGPGFAAPLADLQSLRSTKPLGTGRALRLSQRLAQASGGELRIGASPLGGAAVSIILPSRLS